MKYFILQQEPFFADRFHIEGWQDKINLQWICAQDFYKIPPRNVLTATVGENVPFPDIVTAPFLLMSSLIVDMAEMYGESVYKRNVVIVNSQEFHSKQYYLVLLENLEHGHILLGENNLFCMRMEGRKKIVVSQDLVESILRRGAVGIMLKEIEMFTRRGKQA